MKVIGHQKPRTPKQNLQVLEELIRESEILRPYPKKKGVILRFKTWDELYEFTIKRAARKL